MAGLVWPALSEPGINVDILIFLFRNSILKYEA